MKNLVIFGSLTNYAIHFHPATRLLETMQPYILFKLPPAFQM